MAESYVSYRLLSWGHTPASINGNLFYDLLVIIDGWPLRIQVKGSSDFTSCHRWQFRLKRNNAQLYKANDFDILACVSLPLERVIFVTGKHTKPSTTIPHKDFTIEGEKESWAKAVAKIFETRRNRIR